MIGNTSAREKGLHSLSKNNCCHRVYKQLTILYKCYSSRRAQRVIIRNCFGLKRSGFVRTEDNTCHIVNVAEYIRLNVIFNNNYPGDVGDDIHKESRLRLRRSDVVICISRGGEPRKQNRSSMKRGRKMDSVTIQTTILMERVHIHAFSNLIVKKKKIKKRETIWYIWNFIIVR